MTSYLDQPDLHTKAPFRAAHLTYPGNLKEALRLAQEDKSKTLFGVAHGIPSVFLTKVLASANPDFVWIDVEHGMFNRLTLYDAIHAAQHHSEGRAMVIVRVPKHDEISLSTALDAGAGGIVIPHCESAQEVRDFMKEAYYPPIGNRSFSPWTFTPGVSDTSLYPNDPFNMGTSNRHIAIIPQIESVKGVANLEEIAAVEGVAALMFGPGDFMADAGIPLALGGEPHPVLADAMMKFGMAGQKYKRPLMAAALSIDQVPSMIEQGFGAIVVFFDVWGIAQTVYNNLQAGRAFAADCGKTAEVKTVTNGETIAVVNGTSKPEEKVEPNGAANVESNGTANGKINGTINDAANGIAV